MPQENLKKYQWEKVSINGEDHWRIEFAEPFLELQVFPCKKSQDSWGWTILTDPCCPTPVMSGNSCSSPQRAKIECLESLPYVQRDMDSLIESIRIANAPDKGNKIQIIKSLSGLNPVPDILKVCGIGDILYGEKYIFKTDMEDLLDQIWLPLHLHGFHPISWCNLERFGIEKEPFMSDITYVCPFTKNKFFWFYPSFVVTNNATKYWVGKFEDEEYRKRSSVFDDEWTKNIWRIRKDEPIDVSHIGKSLMGHGYTEGTYPHDGHGTIKEAGVLLSNGDTVFGHTWVWYNK
jgi:hypothetical protein